MKFTSIYLAENKIEIFNSLLGKETIKVNGEEVSSKYSFLGAEHVFYINENGEQVECVLKISTGILGVVFNLYKNGQPVVESPNQGCLGFFIIIIVITIVINLLNTLLN